MKNKAKGKNAIVLCSGGLDSSVVAFLVKKKLKYSNIIVLFFNYGQKSMVQERKCSKLSARAVKARFFEIRLPELRALSASLININGKIRKLKKEDLRNTKKESGKWYVPSRNLLFLSYALSLADSLFIKERKKYDIFLGFKCEGADSYPDSTHAFVRQINKISKISTISNPAVKDPLINKDKEDIIILAKKLDIDLKNTFSCYIGKSKHCGSCLACQLRKAGFYWAGIKDPTFYTNN